MSRRLLAVVALGLGLLGLPGQARAHGENTPTIQTLIDRVEPDVPGLEVDVLRDQAARMQVRNRTGRELAVLAPGGDPFLRIGPRGVFANVASATWYRSGNPDGIANPPEGTKLGGPPRWRRVNRESAFSWFDHRMHPAKVPVPQESVDGQSRARLDDWTVPGRLGGKKIEIDGHVEFRPLRGGVVTRIGGSGTVADGVQVQLLNGALPGLFLTNSRSRPVTVLGKAGEPFARIGPRGVQVNVLSPTHREDAVAKGDASSLGRSDARAAPVWRTVSEANSYAWLDTRARYRAQQPPDRIVNGTKRVVLTRWRVPVEGAGARAAVTGTTAWVPLKRVAASAPRDLGGSERMELALGGLGVLAAVGGAIVLRRRAALRP